MKTLFDLLFWLWIGSSIILSIGTLSAYNIYTVIMILDEETGWLGIFLTISWLSALIYLRYDEKKGYY